MSHARQQIRNAIATLVTGLSTTGSNVYASRIYRLQASELPALLVYTESETSTRSHMQNALERNLSVRVEGIAKATADLDDTLDTIAQEVEAALGGQSPAGVEELVLEGTDMTLNGDAEQPVGSVVMEYLVRYRTTETAPETIL